MKKEFEKNILEAAKALRRAKKVTIVSHVNPDGDTLGCLLALGLALMQADKKVTMLCHDAVPTRFQYLPGSELVNPAGREKPDVSVAVDCGSPKQLGSSGPAFFKAPCTIQIDHHDFGDAFGKIQVLDPEASAVGEIVYELLIALRTDITPAIATCLLTSIIIDTGAFRFSNIRAKTFDICGRLVKKGVDLQRLLEEAYWVKSRSMALLSGYAVSKTKFSKDGAVAWTAVSHEDMVSFGAELSDADSVTDDLRSIEGVKVAALFRETKKGNFRVSLRSKKGINVALVAKQFGGGGHHSSAGCAIRGSETEKKKVLKALEALISR